MAEPEAETVPPLPTVTLEEAISMVDAWDPGFGFQLHQIARALRRGLAEAVDTLAVVDAEIAEHERQGLEDEARLGTLRRENEALRYRLTQTGEAGDGLADEYASPPEAYPLSRVLDLMDAWRPGVERWGLHQMCRVLRAEYDDLRREVDLASKRKGLDRTVTDRPIIFSAPMIRAILSGSKTMTRRKLWREAVDPADRRLKIWVSTPWKKIATGDLLWVREAFAEPNDQVVIYRANWREDAAARQLDNIPADDSRIRWRPSIHMPRSLCRITLRVTGVKIERLQDISEEDALSEGALESGLPYVGAMTCDQARVAFSLLWDSLHGKLSWEQNREVVAISFRREEPRP